MFQHSLISITRSFIYWTIQMILIIISSLLLPTSWIMGTCFKWIQLEGMQTKIQDLQNNSPHRPAIPILMGRCSTCISVAQCTIKKIHRIPFAEGKDLSTNPVQRTLDISRYLFSKELRKTSHISRVRVRYWGVFCEFIVWTKFNFLPFALCSISCYVQPWYV